MSQLVDRLEDARLVERELSTGPDRRAVVVHLTERGRDAATALLDCFDRHAAAICSAFELATRARLDPTAP